jgi:tRNA (guanine37-N1)-methyltransferase
MTKKGKRKMRAYSIIGNIAIVNFPDDFKASEKRKFAKNILKQNKSIKTVLEKSGKFAGRLRKMKTKHLAGEKTKEVLYKENGCVFRFNIDDTYFSPRLSNERKEIASKIKKNSSVLVMFAGVAPYSIVIAKNSKASRVVSNEINRKANKYAEMNLELNKVKDRVELMSGDIKKVASRIKEKFDVIVMPRPQLKDTFLKEAFKLSKKGTVIYYYDFTPIEEIDRVLEKIKSEAADARKRIKILGHKAAGDIAPYKIRIRVDIRVL